MTGLDIVGLFAIWAVVGFVFTLIVLEIFND